MALGGALSSPTGGCGSAPRPRRRSGGWPPAWSQRNEGRGPSRRTGGEGPHRPGRDAPVRPSPALAVQPSEVLKDPALEHGRGKSPRSCAASSARISLSTIPTRRWPRTCAARPGPAGEGRQQSGGAELHRRPLRRVRSAASCLRRTYPSALADPAASPSSSGSSVSGGWPAAARPPGATPVPAEEAEVAALLRRSSLPHRPDSPLPDRSARVLDRGRIAEAGGDDERRNADHLQPQLFVVVPPGWLVCPQGAGLDFTTEVLSGEDSTSRAELLHLSPSFLVPRLRHGDIVVWDTLAIAAYLSETFRRPSSCPRAGRSEPIATPSRGNAFGLRQPALGLPMNIKAFHPGFRLFNGAKADIERIVTIFDDCLDRYEGPYLFGARPAWRTRCMPPSAPASAPTT